MRTSKIHQGLFFALKTLGSFFFFLKKLEDKTYAAPKCKNKIWLFLVTMEGWE